MKRVYETPEADKIAFNYRDQVVAASGTGDISGGSSGENTGNNNGGTSDFVQNTLGVGGNVLCGSGGLLDVAFDLLGSDLCN